MKTNYKYKVLKVLVGLYSALFLVNCSNNSGDSGSAAAPNTGYFQLIGSTCYLNSNGTLTSTDSAKCSQSGTYYYSSGSICYLHSGNGTATQVSSNYCSSNGKNGNYQLVGNTCYQNVNGALTQVNNSLCTSTTGTVGTCQGLHTDGYQWVTCGSQFNCSGYTLMNQQGQVVTCQ